MNKGIIVSILFLFILIGTGYSYWEKQKKDGKTGISLPVIGNVGEPATLTGLVGSEKTPFFDDPQVIEALKKNGFVVNVKKTGSRAIATHPDLSKVDFVFPGGDPATEKIESKIKIKQKYTVWYTPMVVASFDRIANILVKNDVAHQVDGNYYINNFGAIVNWGIEGKKWKDLKENTTYPINKTILVTTTDLSSSNSAALYLALASYMANGEEIVDSNSQDIAQKVKPIFEKQGMQDASSAGPFEDYKSIGVGKTPMVFIYEAQFAEDYLANRNMANKAQMVLMYPEPTIFARQNFLAMSDNAMKLGQLLENDPTLLKLAAEHGWRTKNMNAQALWQGRGLKVPSEIVNVINAPRYDAIETMIQVITGN